MDKEYWRKEILNRRNSLTIKERTLFSKKILDQILKTTFFQNADRIFCYYQMGSEVLTAPIIESAFAQGKNVYLPVAPQKEEMYFLPFKSTKLLEKSSFGVLEPAGSRKEAVAPDINDILFVPGVAFDWKGNRIGYGAGYYDRFFSQHQGIKVGLCFEIQFLQSLPADHWDITMDYIITEKGITALKGGGSI